MRRLLMVALTTGVLAVPSVGGSVVIAAPTCDGEAATIVGTGGDDVIEGTGGRDVIVGLGGNDTIDGKGGRDVICGGAGNDVIDGGRGNDRLFGGSGNDFIDGGPGHDDVFGFDGNDILEGGPGDDLVKGGAGDDEISGGDGDDILHGEAGRDTMHGGNDNDRLSGGGGPDYIRGNGGNDDIDGGPGSDDCRQGPGNGPVRNCEKADLAVRVIAPGIGMEGSAPFEVKVKNRGPQPTSYTLIVDEENHHATCDPPWEGVATQFSRLGPGETRTRIYEPDCTVHEGDSWVEVEAIVAADARDPQPGNDTAKDRTDLQ